MAFSIAGELSLAAHEFETHQVIDPQAAGLEGLAVLAEAPPHLALGEIHQLRRELGRHEAVAPLLARPRVPRPLERLGHGPDGARELVGDAARGLLGDAADPLEADHAQEFTPGTEGEDEVRRRTRVVLLRQRLVLGE